MTAARWCLLAVVLATSPSISFFKYQRQTANAGAGGQHYAILDEPLWQHALPNLDDLRLYASGKEVPYALKTMRGKKETEQTAIRVLQPGTLGGKTQFLLDMSGVSEYDRVTLALNSKNYVAHARVDGQDDVHGTKWVELATITLFDLSGERLGHNSTLQIPISTYKYLRVTVEGVVKPADVQSATAGIERAQEAVWRDINGEAKQTLDGKDTVLTFAVPENVPVERVTLVLDPAQGNFQREIEIQGEKGSPIGAGEISRVHMQRNGGRIDVERTSMSVSATSHGQLRAVIHNGDDAPLKITHASLQQYERRIYFDAGAGSSLLLYYGDPKLGAPVYDYAKLFQSDASAVQIRLGAEEANAVFTGRPDDRPWSERHPSVLWIAILAAVAILGGIALRSIKAAGS